jgi:hypothetical protein
VPVAGRSPRGRLYAGTARRGASPDPDPADAERLPDEPDEAVLPPRGAPPSRDTALPELAASPRLRPPWSLARRGASNDEPPYGVEAELDPIEDPLDMPPLELELEPVDSPPPPRDTAPPPLSPPRDVDSPVVLPFDERCAAAVVGNAIRPPIATARARERANLCFITPPTPESKRMPDRPSKQQICHPNRLVFRPVIPILLPERH